MTATEPLDDALTVGLDVDCGCGVGVGVCMGVVEGVEGSIARVVRI